VRKNSLRHILSNPYVQINSILAGVIVAILIYSGIFSSIGNYPLHSFYELSTGQVAPSSGLSRAFSEIVRLNFNQALALNPYSIRIFCFFAIQLFLRIGLSLIVIAKSNYTKRTVIADITFSLIYLVYAFSPFLLFLTNEIGRRF